MPDTSVQPPYTVVELPFGASGNILPVKRFPDGRNGDVLSDEEVKLWAYIQCLETENLGLRFDAAVPAPDEAENPSRDPNGPNSFSETPPPASVTCPACGTVANYIDDGEYGCEKPGCGWMGTVEDSKAKPKAKPKQSGAKRAEPGKAGAVAKPEPG